MTNILHVALDTPWKLFNELAMYLVKPFVLIYLGFNGVKIGKGSKFYGFPRVYRHRGSRIAIGKNFECRSWRFSNPIGINHPTILCTWAKDASIIIGNDVGISGGSIVAAKKIEIEDRVLIGANSTLIDSDFHPTKGNKRYSKKNIKSFAVKIGADSFIGMNVLIIKGAQVKKGAVVPAGSTVRL